MSRSHRFSEQEQRAIVEKALATSFNQASAIYRVPGSTIRSWKRKYGIRRAPASLPQGGEETSVPSVSGIERLTLEPTPNPEKRLNEAMGDAAVRYADNSPKWFHGRYRDRRAIKEFDAIISAWERAHPKPIPEKDGGVRPGGTGQSKSTTSSAGSGDRLSISARHSSKARWVYVFDAKPVADLAADDPDAWKFLREIVDGRHEMVVPEAVVELYEANKGTNLHLREVFGCKYVKRIALDGEDKPAPRMLCEVAGCTDIVQASVVIVASNCLASLRKRYKIRKRQKRGAWTLEVVTCDPDNIRALVRFTNLKPLIGQQHRGWCLLPLN